MPLRIPASLHQALKQAAYREGVSLNQYCLYLLANQVGSEEAWMKKKGEDLLYFLEEAKVMQKEFDKSRPAPPSPSPRETPRLRFQRLYGHA